MQEEYLIEDKEDSSSTKRSQNRDISFAEPDYEIESMPSRPSRHLIRSLCCLYISPLFGIVALYKSWQVHNNYSNGDYEESAKASKSAKSIANWGFVFAIPMYILSLLFS